MRRILVIDDDEDLTEAVKRNLEDVGDFEVFGCSQGERALQEVKRLHPDLVFLDVLMPGMSGPEVAETLREDSQTKRVPIVFLTAVVSENETREKNNLMGGEHFLAKPVTTDKLVHMNESVLECKR